jgi:DNA-binding MarR family transcriptional regulator
MGRDLETRILRALRDRESSTVDELADDSSAPGPFVRAFLEGLERAGWVQRDRGNVDKEPDVWWLTD